MLTPDQAREALNRTRDPGWKKKALAAIESLSEAARPIGWVLLDRDLTGQETKNLDWNEKTQLQRDAARRLDEIAVADRMGLWSAFFPRLDAGLVERTWQALKSARLPGSLQPQAVPRPRQRSGQPGTAVRLAPHDGGGTRPVQLRPRLGCGLGGARRLALCLHRPPAGHGDRHGRT